MNIQARSEQRHEVPAPRTAGPPGGGTPRAESSSTFRSVQHTAPVRLLLRGFLLATRFLPVWFLRGVGLIVVSIFMAFTGNNVRAVMANMKGISPGASTLRSFWTAFQVYKNYSYYLIDLFYLSHDLGRLKEYRFDVKGLDHFLRGVDGGAVLLTTHLGNWELGGLALAGKGREINVVYSPDSSGLLEEQRRRIRGTEAVHEIPLRPGEFSSLRLLRILEEGGNIALQGDRLLLDRGVSMPFRGRRATFPQGPVKLAMLANAAVVPAFIPMTGYKSYEIVVEEPLRMDPAAGVEYNLGRVIEVLEKYLSRYPEQWYAFSPFWDEDKEALR